MLMMIALYLAILLWVWRTASIANTAGHPLLFQLLSTHLRQFNIGASSVLLTLCGTFWLLNRREHVFLWLWLGLLSFVAVSSSGLDNAIPFAGAMSKTGLLALPFAGLAVLLFSAHLTQRQLPQGVVATLVTLPFFCFAIETTEILTPNLIRLVLIVPTLELSLLGAVAILIAGNIRHLAWDQLLLATCIAGLAIGILIDVLARIDYLQHAAHLAPLAGHGLLLAIAAHLMHRQQQLMTTTTQLVAQQDSALRQQATVLANEFSRTEKLISERASLEEQKRLTSLLHSGVASNLSSIVAIQVDQNLDPALGMSARHGLFEVRLMTNTAGEKVPVMATLRDYFDAVVAPTQPVPTPIDLRACNERPSTAVLNRLIEMTRVIHEIMLTLSVAALGSVIRCELSDDTEGCTTLLFIQSTDTTTKRIEEALQGARAHALAINLELRFTLTANGLRITLKPKA